MYIGMQDQWFTFNMFDTQAWYARDVILGRIQLPNRSTMNSEHAKWRAAEEAIEPTDEANIRYQANYVQRYVNQKRKSGTRMEHCSNRHSDFY